VGDKAYLIRFKDADLQPNIVVAADIELHGEHSIFLKSDGSLAALYLFGIVKSWSEID
jgi:hypothetical protein